MKLRRVNLTNYRGIAAMELPLDPQLTVLVGDNAAGKTSVLDGIAVGLGALVGRFPGVSGCSFKKGDIRSKWPQLDFDHRVQSINQEAFVRIGLESINEVCWDRTERRDRTNRTQTAIPQGYGLKALNTWIDSLIDTLTQDSQAATDLPIAVYYGTDRAVLTLPQRRSGFRKEFNRYDALQDALKATTHFKGVFEWFIAKEDEERREKERQRNWDYRLSALEAVRRAVSRMIPGSRDPHTELHPLRFLITLEVEKGNPEQLSLDQLSDGYRTLLALVMDLARRMAQANPHRAADAIESEAIVLIDEVDLHLHPRWQQRVLVDLTRTFPNAQFIVTSHSPQVLTSAKPEQIIRLSRSEQGITPEQATSSYGAESSRLLEEIMNVSTRPPAEFNEFTRLLNEYQNLIEQNAGNSEKAQQLRQQLNELSSDDPVLLRADMEIRRRRLIGK